jgi:hypothetical protein
MKQPEDLPGLQAVSDRIDSPKRRSAALRRKLHPHLKIGFGVDTDQDVVLVGGNDLGVEHFVTPLTKSGFIHIVAISVPWCDLEVGDCPAMFVNTDQKRVFLARRHLFGLWKDSELR